MKKFWILALILIFLASIPASAKMKKLGQAGMTFLKIGGSARAAGMANVFDFAKGDLASVFYNPAGLASVPNRAFFFNYTKWLADMGVSHAAVSWNLGAYGVFGLTAQMMDYGAIDGTAISDTDVRGYTDIDVGDVGALSLGLAYGKQMTDKFSIGGCVKFVSQKLGSNDTYTGGSIETKGKQNKVSGLAYDFGTSYDTGIKSLRLTMSLRNYSGQLLYENEEFQLPQTYKIGLSANLFELLPFTSGSDKSLTFAIEGVSARDRAEYMNFGAEYSLMNLIDLRAGWAAQRNEDNAGGLAAGAGLKLDNFGFAGRVDVSYSDFGSIFGSVMRVSVSGSF